MASSAKLRLCSQTTPFTMRLPKWGISGLCPGLPGRRSLGNGAGFLKNTYRAVDKIMKPEREPIPNRREGQKSGFFLRQNFEKLRRENPDLAIRLKNTHPPPEIQVIFSRTGLPVIRIGQATFHSMMDPEKEARDWAGRVKV